MSTIEQTAEKTVGEIFTERHTGYWRDNYPVSDWNSPSPQSLHDMFISLGMRPGYVEVGKFGPVTAQVDYIFIQSKVGGFFMYKQPDGSVHYVCEEQHAICASFKRQGFNGTTGEIDTAEKMGHIFAIPDSYL